jgi:hypothetical protein
LVAGSINHGIQLEKHPVLQYLYANLSLIFSCFPFPSSSPYAIFCNFRHINHREFPELFPAIIQIQIQSHHHSLVRLPCLTSKQNATPFHPTPLHSLFPLHSTTLHCEYFSNLLGHCVLFNQGLLGTVELHRIIGGERDVHP